MSKLVLLHGFAIGLTSPLVRPPFGPSASMSAFDAQITSGEATVFPWGIEKHVQPWELLNPFCFYRLYKTELHLVHSDTVQSELRTFLAAQKPSIIVAHSMGCTLLQQHLEKYSLPDSVKSIVLIQSDLPANLQLHTTTPIHHLYCPWDPTLLISSVHNRKLRAGLLPSKQINSFNHLFPLTCFPDLHMSSIHDKNLLTFIKTIHTE